MTQQDADDASALPDLLDQIPADVPMTSFGATVRTTAGKAMRSLRRVMPQRRF